MSTEITQEILQRVIGFKVEDCAGERVGTIQNLWSDEKEQPVLLGVKTGWIFGKNHVVPVAEAEVNDFQQVVRLPFTAEQVKGAPTFPPDAEIADYDQDRIFTYYGVNLAGSSPAPTAPAAEASSLQQEQMNAPATPSPDEQTILLKEEQVKVGKREVESGGIRLRKVIRTETVNQPVELKREEIVIERVPADDKSSSSQRFGDEDVYIPLRREEAVVQKKAGVTEEVNVSKKLETERAQVTEQVRKEELRVQQEKPKGRP